MTRAIALLVSATFSATLAIAQPLPKLAPVTTSAPVTLIDNGDSWTMDNGIVKMTVLKRNGNLSSLVYHGIEILTRGEYWEQTPSGTITARVTIDPATNLGERAEVSVLGVNPGDPNHPSPLGGPPGSGVPLAQEQRVPGASGPGANPAVRFGGARPTGPRGGGMDIETRYTLERGASGFYTYAEYTHKASYPPAG